MKSIISIILCVIFTILLNAHEEFYKKSISNPCTVVEVTTNYNNGEIITWMSYTNIPIAADWTIDFPFELNVSTVTEHFENAVANWNLFSGSQLFNLQSSFGYNVRVHFTTSDVIFPAGMIRYAIVYHKFEENAGRDYFLPYSSFCQAYGEYTTIYLNNKSNKGFTWRTDHYIPPSYFNEIDF